MVVGDQAVSVAPERASWTDDPAEILAFAVSAFAEGPVALATLVEIRGGAARALGAQIAITASGRFCGFVSGGCIEAAVAAEAVEAIQAGKDRLVRFGEGSPFLDIVMPCGGGITVAIHPLRDARPLTEVLEHLSRRQPAGLRYVPEIQSLMCVRGPGLTGWASSSFTTMFKPKIRLILSGQSVEAVAVTRLASVLNFDVLTVDHNHTADMLSGEIDPLTAVIFLHHDLDAETRLLPAALRSRAFYIGAIGSSRTHQKRRETLKAMGFADAAIGRIRGPIGLFGPTRDAASLALSVLAEIAATRLAEAP